MKTLFDSVSKGTLFNDPPSSGPATSAMAADEIKADAASLRRRVLGYLLDCGADGATDEEIQAALGMGGDTERPRRWELKRMRLIRDSGQKRLTKAGRLAAVWVVAESCKEVNAR